MNTVSTEATKLARWKIEFVAEAMSSKRWRRFLRWLTALAQVHISICFIFCIFFAFAFWFTKPRMIDHIYNGNATTKVIVVLSQGWLEKSAKMREDAQNRICEIKKEISIWIIVMKCCLLMRKNKLERNMTWGHVLLHYCIISMLFSAKWEKTPKNKSLLTTKRYFLSMLLKNWNSVIISNDFRCDLKRTKWEMSTPSSI